MLSHSVYLAVSSIPDWSVSAFPHGRIFPSFIFHTWIVAVGESQGEVLCSQGPLKRLSLSAVLRSSLDDVISISVFAGNWLWASLKFLALSAPSFWRVSAASFVFRAIEFLVDVMLMHIIPFGVGVVMWEHRWQFQLP